MSKKSQIFRAMKTAVETVVPKMGTTISLSLATVLIVLTGSAQASFSYLRPQFASDAPSTDRRLMARALEQAKRENKSVLLDLSAAWCGPCMAFKKYLHDNPNEINRIKEKYVFVMSEDQKLTMPWGLWDSIPLINNFFPTFVIYTPANGWQLVMGGATEKDAVDYLVAFGKRARPSIATHRNTLRTALRQNTRIGQSSPGAVGEMVLFVLFEGYFSYSYSDLKPLLTDFTAAMASRPELFDEDLRKYSDWYFNSGFQLLMQSGSTSLAQITRDFPAYGKSLRTGSEGRDSLFLLPLIQTLESQGLRAAAQACNGLWNSAKGQILPSPKTPDAAAEIFALETDARISCLYLKAQTLGSDRSSGIQDLSQLMADIEASTIPVESKNHLKSTLWKVHFSLTDFSAAASLYESALERTNAGYLKELEKLNQALEQARRDGDTAAEKETLSEIEFTKFQQNYHVEEVGRQVLNSLRSGTPVQHLHLM